MPARYAKGIRPVIALGFSPASLYTYKNMPGCISPGNHETVFVSCMKTLYLHVPSCQSTPAHSNGPVGKAPGGGGNGGGDGVVGGGEGGGGGGLGGGLGGGADGDSTTTTLVVIISPTKKPIIVSIATM